MDEYRISAISVASEAAISDIETPIIVDSSYMDTVDTTRDILDHALRVYDMPYIPINKITIRKFRLFKEKG